MVCGARESLHTVAVADSKAHVCVYGLLQAACALYPVDGPFLDNVAHEVRATTQSRRSRQWSLTNTHAHTAPTDCGQHSAPAQPSIHRCVVGQQRERGSCGHRLVWHQGPYSIVLCHVRRAVLWDRVCVRENCLACLLACPSCHACSVFGQQTASHGPRQAGICPRLTQAGQCCQAHHPMVMRLPLIQSPRTPTTRYVSLQTLSC